MKYKFLFLTLIPLILLSNTSYATFTEGTKSDLIQCLKNQLNILTSSAQKLNDDLNALQIKSNTNDQNSLTLSQFISAQSQQQAQAQSQLQNDMKNLIQLKITDPNLYSNKVLKLMHAGTVIAFAGDTIPNGWLLCNGKPLSKATYPQLAEVLGDKYGPNSDGNFYPPDYQGVFLRGTSGTSGRDPDAESRTALNGGTAKGNTVGSYQEDMFKSHNHGIDWQILQQGDCCNSGQNPWSNQTASHLGNQGTSYTGGNETRPKNVNVNFIIFSGVIQ